MGITEFCVGFVICLIISVILESEKREGEI
nr:MAG TPA_asm: hypothetical protein [Caudoviricetes sp.]